jgi:hypothetical protein
MERSVPDALCGSDMALPLSYLMSGSSGFEAAEFENA